MEFSGINASASAYDAGRRIDVHHHYVPPVFKTEVLAKITASPTGTRQYMPPMMNWTPEKTLEDMDRGGTATAMLSITNPGAWVGNQTASRKLAHECNEYAARMAADHPGRFGIWTALCLPDVDGSLREIEYGLDVLKADGVGCFTSYDNKHLGDPAFAPVLEELNRRKAVLYTHPALCPCCAALVPEVNEAIIEYGTDTTRTVASLLFSGAATKYPDIRFIFSHAGGTMPFLIERFQLWARRPDKAPQLPRGVMHEIERFFYDTAQAANAAAMACLRKVIPVSQIVFGTDFPYRTAEEHVTGLRTCGFSEQELRQIDRENALRLVPRLQ